MCGPDAHVGKFLEFLEHTGAFCSGTGSLLPLVLQGEVDQNSVGKNVCAAKPLSSSLWAAGTVRR